MTEIQSWAWRAGTGWGGGGVVTGLGALSSRLPLQTGCTDTQSVLFQAQGAEIPVIIWVGFRLIGVFLSVDPSLQGQLQTHFKSICQLPML